MFTNSLDCDIKMGTYKDIKLIYHHIIMHQGIVHVISNGTDWSEIQSSTAEYTTRWMSWQIRALHVYKESYNGKTEQSNSKSNKVKRKGLVFQFSKVLQQSKRGRERERRSKNLVDTSNSNSRRQAKFPNSCKKNKRQVESHFLKSMRGHIIREKKERIHSTMK